MANDLTISFSFLAQVSGGPQLSVASPTLTVKAYDMIQQTLDPPVGGAGPVPVDVGFPNATVPQLVAIVASQYSSDPVKHVSYEVGGAAPPRQLDAPHLFLGTGAASFLGNPAPNKLTFTNASDAPVTVQILVGRSG